MESKSESEDTVFEDAIDAGADDFYAGITFIWFQLALIN